MGSLTAWVPRISFDQRKQFELDMDKYLRGYRKITEVNGHGLIVPARKRDAYFPIQHLFTNYDTELFIRLSNNPVVDSIFELKNILTNANLDKLFNGDISSLYFLPKRKSDNDRSVSSVDSDISV